MIHREWKKGIGLGFLSGVATGWISIALNSLTGVFRFESGLLLNIVTFSIGGAVFGIVVGAFMALLGDLLPLKDLVSKAISISAGLWLLLRFTGFLLSLNNPVRYHGDFSQTLQGFTLAIILGAILGILWKSEPGKTV